MLACKRGHEEVVRVLLTAGAELHQKDSRGRTARDTASKRSHDTILAMLHPSKQMRLMQVGNQEMSSQSFSNPFCKTRDNTSDRLKPLNHGIRGFYAHSTPAYRRVTVVPREEGGMSFGGLRCGLRH